MGGAFEPERQERRRGRREYCANKRINNNPLAMHIPVRLSPPSGVYGTVPLHQHLSGAYRTPLIAVVGRLDVCSSTCANDRCSSMLQTEPSQFFLLNATFRISEGQ